MKHENVVSLDPVLQGTEDHLALGFSDRMEGCLRYVAKWGKWFQWDGTCWREDQTHHVFDMVRAHCREASEAANDPNKRKAAAKAKTIAAVERLTRADRRHAATVDQWDRDPWLLNTPGAVIDLRTGERLTHDPSQYMTKETKVSPGGDCRLWLFVLKEIMGGDEDLVAFLQRWFGYSLTGSTQEHAFAFFYGTGANGKGTVLNTVTNIMGDYAQVAAVDTFTASKGERHLTELARMRGARFVQAQETEEGRQWAEARIKSLTGGDPITANFMRQDHFTFTPAFKLTIAGNHKPSLRNVDEAMRRRLMLVPFTVTIPKEERDPALAEKLKPEWSGILQWMIDGCVQYKEGGLKAPMSITAATDAYFESQDLFGQWLEDCCDRKWGYWEATSRLMASWGMYCDAAQEKPGSAKQFAEKLSQAGFKSAKNSAGTARGWAGLRLK